MPQSLAAFYRGKRVLVTGHTGFQGGWLVSWLKLLGVQVCGYGLPPASRPNFFDATVVDRGITSIFADIRDRNALATAFTEFQPEIVFHCAAQTRLESAIQDPVQTFAANTLGTIHFLDEIRQTRSVRAAVMTSHVEPYQDRGWFWGDSKQALYSASEPVSSSFACAELAVSAYIESFFSKTRTAVAVARIPNLIGGGDWAAGRLIPDLVRKITSNEPIVITASGVAPWLHVIEVARAYLLLGERLFDGRLSGAWYFGPAESDTMQSSDLARSFAEHWGEVEIQIEPEAGSDAHQLLDTIAARALGWSPLLTIEEAIRWTVEWYRSYYSHPDSACRVTEEQINRYMRMQ